MITENAVVTVVRSKSTGTDQYNNVTPNWNDVDEFDGLPAQVQPMNSEEAIRDRDTLTVHLHLWAEWRQQDLRYTDRIEYRGDTYEVDGVVDVEYLGEAFAHYHAMLKRVT